MSEQTFLRQFGEKLRELRTALGISQESLAADAGLHRTHISLIERGRRSVRIETIYRLSTALRVQPSSLMPGANPSSAKAREPFISPHISPHPDLKVLDSLFPSVRLYQMLASRHGINDVFQDNGGKLLQTLLLLNLKATGKREGNDAFDEEGKEYELKTVNIKLTKSFSTHHHLNPVILSKYRNVEAWFFSIYHDIELVKVVRMRPDQLEADFFSKWEAKWMENSKDINNPKIPVKYVVENGELLYEGDVDFTIGTGT